MKFIFNYNKKLVLDYKFNILNLEGIGRYWSGIVILYHVCF